MTMNLGFSAAVISRATCGHFAVAALVVTDRALAAKLDDCIILQPNALKTKLRWLQRYCGL
jgi:hypothetical protein